MARCAKDIAVLMDVLIDRSQAKDVPEGGYTAALSKSFKGIRMEILEPSEWKMPPHVMFPIEEANLQEDREILAAYEKLRGLGVEVKKVTVASLDGLVVNGHNLIGRVMDSQFLRALETNLATLVESKVRTLEDVIVFMQDHADLEMPEVSPNIQSLEDALAYKITTEEYQSALAEMRDWGRHRAVDKCLKEFGVDVILGSGDSRINELSSTAGYPIATLPLSYLDYNGRPFGLAAVSSAHTEALLIQLMSAWEVAFPERKLPTRLLG